MPLFKKDKKVNEKYEEISSKIAHFAFNYNKIIEEAKGTNKKVLPKTMCKILYYPSRFILRYNAVKRVNELCTKFLVYMNVSQYMVDEITLKQNIQLNECFSRYHTVGRFVTFLFSLLSSSIIIPSIYYIFLALLKYFNVNIIEFDWGTFFIILIFMMTVIVGYNYLEYDRLRGDLKKDFIQIKNEISQLP